MQKNDYYESEAFYDDFLDELDEHPHNLIIQKTRALPRQESFEQGRLKGHDEILGQLRQQDNLISTKTIPEKHPRADKGKTHRKRPKHTSEWGKKAKDVADDFKKAAQFLEHGAPKVGDCSEAKIKQWDIKYPDADHKNKWGYYADLRLRAHLKDEYNKVLRYWVCYWADYKRQFLQWRRTHQGSPRKSFRFKQLVKIEGFNPEWIGQDDKGEFYNTPRVSRDK